MYAVIRTGGKQYRVSQDDILRVENLKAEVNSEVKFEVLAVGEGESLQVGTPVLSSAEVSAKVIRHARAKKVIIYRFKRRKKYHRKKGHRQGFTEVRISSIHA